MQQAAFQCFVQRNGQWLSLWFGRVTQANMTALLPNANIAELFENSYDLRRREPAA
jgi:hypothetical protein